MNLLEYRGSHLAKATEAVAGYLADMTVDLYKEQLDLDPQTPVSDLTDAVANYTGYAQGVVTWGTPTVADDGQVEVIGTLTAFRPTGTTVGNVVYGLFCRQDGTGTLLFAGAFDSGIPMGSTLDQLIITIRYRPATESVIVVIS